MKPKILSIILIFSLALNLAVIGTFIFRKFEPPLRPDDFLPGPDRMPSFENMNLDENQRNEIRQLMRKFRQINRENRHVIFELEDELFNTLRQVDYDSVKADSLIDKIAKLRTQQSKQAIKHFRKFNKFLTPEQQEHFHRMIMERPVRHGTGGGGWRRGPRRMENNIRQQFRSDSLDKTD